MNHGFRHDFMASSAPIVQSLTRLYDDIEAQTRSVRQTLSHIADSIPARESFKPAIYAGELQSFLDSMAVPRIRMIDDLTYFAGTLASSWEMQNSAFKALREQVAELQVSRPRVVLNQPPSPLSTFHTSPAPDQPIRVVVVGMEVKRNPPAEPPPDPPQRPIGFRPPNAS